MSETYNSELFTPLDANSCLKKYKIEKLSTVEEVLKKINLSEKYFAILVDGKKVKTNYELKKGEILMILPKIAGGIEKIIE